MALALAALAVTAGGLRAQSPREAYVGSTAGIGRQQAPGLQQAQGQAQARVHLDEAIRLLDQAESDLAHARPLDARRTLETVVERFGGTWAADEARRMLAPIYAADPNLRRPAVESEPPRRSRFGARAAPRDERQGVGLSPQANREAEVRWRTEVLRNRKLEHEFRATVGDRVFFGDGSTNVGALSRAVLAAQAAWLKRNPDLAITIEAHADDRGGRELNDDLAAQRGEAVRLRLVEEGIEPTRIRVRAAGRDRPVAPCQEAGCAAQNRRVVTLVGEVEDPRQPADLRGPVAGGPGLAGRRN